MQLKKHKWGYGITLFDRKWFKIKLLRFRGSKSCSHQRHKDRSELWLFLSGEGIMTGNGGETYGVAAGEYALIDAGTWHKYSAITPTWVLECQFGRICSEEDIERK
jgi:mannose-6-phosphate isomerase-like protein (cupin superfamily)